MTSKSIAQEGERTAWVDTLYLTVEEAAQYAGIGVNAMREFVASADPPPILRIGRRPYIERAGLAGYLRSKQETGRRP